MRKKLQVRSMFTAYLDAYLGAVEDDGVICDRGNWEAVKRFVEEDV